MKSYKPSSKSHIRTCRPSRTYVWAYTNDRDGLHKRMCNLTCTIVLTESSFPRQDPKICLLFDLIAKHHRKIRMSGKEGFYFSTSGLGMMITQ